MKAYVEESSQLGIYKEMIGQFHVPVDLSQEKGPLSKE